MPTRDEPVTIAFGFDGRYAPHAASVLASIVSHAPDARLRFIVLYVDIEPADMARLEAVAPAAEFVWRLVGDEDLPSFADRSHFTRATLFRLGLEKMAPADCDRVIYLDVDISVVGDLRPLWDVDLEGNLLGAVLDEQVDAEQFAKTWDLSPGGAYFNAGVLLVDLKKVREERAFARAADFVATHDKDLPWNDQDGLNWVSWGKWRALDPHWNVQRNTAIRYAKGEARPLSVPSIIHYTGHEKPWIRGAYHPWSWVYWRNLLRTSFADDVRRGGGVGWPLLLRCWLRYRLRKPAAMVA